MSPKNDPVIDEIREIRREISERMGHDPRRLVAYYQQLQEQYRSRLIGNSQHRDSHDSPG